MLKTVLSLVFFATCSMAQNKNPLWDTEQDFRDYEPKILELIRQYEADPLREDAPRSVYIVNSWAVSVPYIGFTRYQKYLSEISKDYKYYEQLFNGYTFGEIKLKLSTGKKVVPESEAAGASLKSMLIVYDRICASSEDAASELLESYKEMEKTGILLDHFKSINIQGTMIREKEMPSYYDQVEYGVKIRNKDGKKVKLKEWKKKDILILYVSSSCPHCKILAKRYKNETKTDIDIILVFSKINTENQAREFLDSVKTGFNHYYDYDGQFYKEYGGGIVPVSLLLKKNGTAIRVGGALDEKISELIGEMNGIQR